MGYFGFFQLIKNYAETTSLIDKEYLSQEASHTAQKVLERLKFSQILSKIKGKYFCLIVKKRGFYYMKPKIFD